MQFLKYYLPLSIRAGAYASNLFFGSIIIFSLQRFVASPVIENLVIWGFGLILYEIIWWIINRTYKSKSLAVGDPDYEYRTTIEKLILQLGCFYGIQLMVVLVLYGLGHVSGQLETNLGLATFGGFFQIFNFFGVVIMAISASASSSLKRILPSVFALCFMLPLICYVIYTFRFFY